MADAPKDIGYTHVVLQERRTEPTPSQKRLDRIIGLLEEIVAHQARAEARAVVLLADQQHYGDEARS